MNKLLSKGRARLNQVMERRLAWSVVVLVVMQVQGYLPSLDFLPARELKLTSFALAVVLTISKGIEMFYEKSEALVRTGEIAPEKPNTENAS